MMLRHDCRTHDCHEHPHPLGHERPAPVEPATSDDDDEVPPDPRW